MQFPRRPAFDRKGSLLPNARCKDLSLGAGAHSRAGKNLWIRSLTTNGLPPSKECAKVNDMKWSMKGGGFKKKRARRPLVKSFLFLMWNVKCEKWNVKCEKWNVRIQIKNEDENRFILNKEIVEKYKKIVEISKYYLKGNIPSTVNVLRAGK